MKQIATLSYIGVILFVFLFFFACAEDNMITQDSVLAKIKGLIPENWKMKIVEDNIVFEREGDTWVLFENRINAPLSLDTDESTAIRIKNNGTRTRTIVKYRYKTKWSKAKIVEAVRNNNKIRDRISKLIQSYSIEHLYDKFASSKGGEYFSQGTTEEQKRVASYQEEKAALEKKLVLLPEYETESASLFPVSGNGYEDMNQLVYPREASEEAFTVMKIVSENCKIISRKKNAVNVQFNAPLTAHHPVTERNRNGT
jgi:hypothetical protein